MSNKENWLQYRWQFKNWQIFKNIEDILAVKIQIWSDENFISSLNFLMKYFEKDITRKVWAKNKYIHRMKIFYW